MGLLINIIKNTEMKSINKIFFMLVAVATFMLTSCSDDDYAPGIITNAEGLNVFFDASNESAVILGPTTNEFSIVVSRNKTDKAVSVPLTVSDLNSDLFEVPTRVDFSAGEASKTITIKVNEGMQMFVAYPLSIAIDPSYTTPYAESTVYPRAELEITKEDYAPYATGLYSSEFWEDDDANPLETDVTLEYSEILKQYRLKECWGKKTGVIIFTWEGAEAVELITTAVSVGLDAGDYGNVTANKSGECTYDANSKTFAFPFKWTVSAGSFGVYTDYYTIKSIL